MLVDTHAHLFWDSFKEDYEEVLDRAIDAGLGTIINVGVDLNTSDIVRNLKSQKIQFLASVAIHPEEVVQYFSENSDTNVSIHKDIEQLGTMLSVNSTNPTPIVAVGECGLDFAFANSPWIPSSPTTFGQTKQPINISSKKIKEIQIKLFQAHIDLAKKHHLPLLIHCRDDRNLNPENTEAWDKTIEMTKDHFGIYHCYSGLPHTTNQVLSSTNFLISFACNITYPKNDYLREAASLAPLDRIVLETDCPFLAPQIKRGQRNEPANVVEVAKTIAEVKGISLEEVAKHTTENAKKLLKI